MIGFVLLIAWMVCLFVASVSFLVFVFVCVVFVGFRLLLLRLLLFCCFSVCFDGLVCLLVSGC